MKSILITGAQGTGKTFYAKKFIEESGSKSTWINSTNLKNPFLFSDCEKNTEIVVFDEISDNKILTRLIEMSKDYITVNKRNRQTFRIKPAFIIISQMETEIIMNDIPLENSFAIMELKTNN